MMWGHYDSFSWWWFVIMPLGMIGFWALIAWLLINVVRGNRAEPKSTPTAETILAERYARGDIDADDYHRRLGDLQTASEPSAGR